MILEITIVAISVILFLIMLSVGWGIGTYNLFINLKQSIINQWSNIKTEYQRRADLFMNLVEATKSYKKHEKETLQHITEARNGNFGTNVLDQVKKLKQLDGMFSKMLLTFEAYPNLKANEQHNKLMDEIRITEDRINIARTDLNGIVREYNINVKMFPTSIIANMFRFAEEKYFENEPSNNQSPRIKLE